jgi:hypothetical protein
MAESSSKAKDMKSVTAGASIGRSVISDLMPKAPVSAVK